MIKRLPLTPILVSLVLLQGCSQAPADSSPSPAQTAESRSAETPVNDPQAQDKLGQCTTNLKNLGTVSEMYSTDYSGRYPKTMDLLTPNYLKTIPTCPEAEAVSYSYQEGGDLPLNGKGFKNYYIWRCDGGHHEAVGVAGDFPVYDGISGVIPDQEAYNQALNEAEEARSQQQESQSP